jgi:GlcNAc-PI de-N-acetylase
MRSRFGLGVTVLLILGCVVGAKRSLATTGVCGGISSYPVRPLTGAALCPPYSSPIIFFAAHPDDETLGMSGAIRAAKAAGRTVIVELMTHGEGSGSCLSVFPDTTTCGNARVNEFTESMIRLGVDGVVGGKDGGNNFGDKQLLYSAGTPHPDIGASQDYCAYSNLSPHPGVTARINFWLSHGGPGMSLRGTSGVSDFNCHPDHYAVSLALKNAGFADTKYYQVYRIRDPNRNSASTTNWRGETVFIVRENTNPYCGTPGATDCSYASNRGNGKRAGLSAYNINCPQDGLYGFGWGYSTGDLFSAYDADCAAGNAAEYVDYVPTPLSAYISGPTAVAAGMSIGDRLRPRFCG